MSESANIIGKNIRQIRNLRGMTIQQLVERLQLFDLVISAGLLSAWQRGQRRICAEYLQKLSLALNCTIDALYGQAQQILGISSALTDRQRGIIGFMFSDWQGDVQALIQFNALYMAADRQTRAQIVGNALRIYRQARNSGMIQQAPYEVRTGYLQRKWGQLDG